MMGTTGAFCINQASQVSKGSTNGNETLPRSCFNLWGKRRKGGGRGEREVTYRRNTSSSSEHQ